VKRAVREMTEKTLEWSVAVSELCLADPLPEPIVRADEMSHLRAAAPRPW
jgi:hypothetical protein